MDKTTFVIYAITLFLGIFVFSLLINKLLLKFYVNFGIRNNRDTSQRWSKISNPSFGGITFFISFLIVFVAHSFIVQESYNFINIIALGIVFASIVGFMLGLFDDSYNTKPLIKLFSQIFIGVILVVSGTYIHIFSNEWLNYIITIVWVVGIMNSINMLDNMDGISTIASLTVFITVLIYLFFLQEPRYFHYTLLIGMIATLFSFLFFNWHPSKMFMGDTGSQFIGVLLAFFGIIYFWNGGEINLEHSGSEVVEWKNILSLFLVFLIPFADTFTVVVKRISVGKPPYIGGKDHTTHHLSYLGMKDSQIAWLFILISIISIVMNIYLMNFVEVLSAFLVIGYVIFIFIVFSALFYIANLNKDRN